MRVFAIIKSNILYNFAAVLSNVGKAFKKKTAQKKLMRKNFLVILLNMCYNSIHFEIYSNIQERLWHTKCC